MIHLDTNYLIGLLGNSSTRSQLEKWFRAGETLATSSIAWSEFVTGPVTSDEVDEAAAMLENRILPFGIAEANLAAYLFNRAGRKKGLRIDSYIAAAAICSSAHLATRNPKDFLPFVPSGLRLA